MRLFQPALIVLLLLAAPANAQEVGAGIEAYGRGDFAAALREWRPLAERGDGEAQASLGLLYALGQGVPRDFAEAIKWFELSAEQGYAIGQNNLAVMYRDGQGVAQDYAVALKLFRLSAEQGYPVAQYSLGAMYVNGHGVTADIAEAYVWYALAAQQGHRGANQARLSLGPRLSVAQKEAANARVVEFQKRKKEARSPVSPKPAERAAEKPPRLAAGAAWRVQLASLNGQSAAEAEWGKLRRANSDLLGDLTLHVQIAELSKGTFYRVQAGPLADRAAAAALCDSLKSRNQSCLIVGR